MISEELESYCYVRIYRLARLYDAALSSGMKYEDAFFHVMNLLDIPHEEQEEILAKTKDKKGNHVSEEENVSIVFNKCLDRRLKLGVT